MTTFAAIDFETANPNRDSACSVGLVIVEDGKIVENLNSLIKPIKAPTWFTFTGVHGITAADVKDAPTFSDVFAEIKRMTRDIETVVAHNAPFDRSVLIKSMESAGIPLKEIESNFACTLSLVRKKMKLPNYSLSTVAKELEITLDHHDALSDARAAGLIASRALISSGEKTLQEFYKTIGSDHGTLEWYASGKPKR